MRRPVVALLFAGCCAVAVLAAPPDADKPKPRAKSKNPLDHIEGYTRHTIEGFTLLVSEDVADADTTPYTRKPMDVLAMELKAVTRLLPAKTTDALRKLPIWVEWDKQESLHNGREGTAVAVYRAGDARQMVMEKRHPLTSRTITILRMKTLTEEHQPKRESGRCVMLHELAHAVHDQLLGTNNPQIRVLYQQAMERKLYDKDSYVATNEAEFFAELTSAYFDQLPFYPRTRAELKKHDPATFKYMEQVWGTATPTAKATPSKKTDDKPASLASTNGGDIFDLSVKLADVAFGGQVAGPELKTSELSGRVVVVGFWTPNEVGLLTRLGKLHDELAAYQVTVIAAGPPGLDPDAQKQTLADRGVEFVAVDKAGLKEKGKDTAMTLPAPHTFVFDHAGACVFRGPGYEAERHVRAAAGKRLLAKLDRTEFPKPFQPAADALASGDPLPLSAAKFGGLTSHPDPVVAASAKATLAAVMAPATDALAEAKKKAKFDPLGAYLLYEKVTTDFKGTGAATRAADAMQELRGDKLVAAEIKARTKLEEVKKLETFLSSRPGSFRPTADTFQKSYALPLAQIAAAVKEMKKKFPTAKATAAAEKLAKPYLPAGE